MHCRPSCPTNDSTCSFSFLFLHPDYTNTINHHTCPSSSYHDQIPPPAPRRRRRLEDPIITYASNYYATYPQQTSRSSTPTPQLSQSPPIPTSRQIYEQSEDKNIYCDLFNLLDRPPPVKQRRKYTLNDYNPCRRLRSIDYKNAHAKLKDISNPKLSYFKEKRHQNDKLSSIHQPYERLQDKSKNNNCSYQRHPLNKGFFRRVARSYFCMPMTVTNGEFSS